MSEMEIPLFPLGSELKTGQRLSLRIFEPRYLEMIKRVAGKEEAFGIVRILSGHEVGETPTVVSHATLATIVDFDTLPDGLLGITVLGERPIRIHRTWVQADGLMMALVSPLPPRNQSMSRETHSEDAGPMDYQVAEGLGVPVAEYVQALLGKRVQTERLEAGTIVNGIKLAKTRVIFRYQGRSTYIELDE
ncbi:MAG: LON peptidase substrate-binding domain-containing protein [Magnetococcales bacterium]|nr:LON peptidase substrate-binding domain-containing protein [Magnetococcales bacterium]